MPLVCLGISHHAAPAEVRERHAFPPDHMSEALVALRDYDTVREAAMLSTCNRSRSTPTSTMPTRHCTAQRVSGQFPPQRSRLRSRAVSLHVDRNGGDRTPDARRDRSRLDADRRSRDPRPGERSLSSSAARAFARQDAAPPLPRRDQRRQSARSSTTIGNESVSLATVAVTMAKRCDVGPLDGKNIVCRRRKDGPHGRETAQARRRARSHRRQSQLRSRARARRRPRHRPGVEFSRCSKRSVAADIVISSTGATHFVLTPGLIAEATIGRQHVRFLDRHRGSARRGSARRDASRASSSPTSTNSAKRST